MIGSGAGLGAENLRVAQNLMSDEVVTFAGEKELVGRLDLRVERGGKGLGGVGVESLSDDENFKVRVELLEEGVVLVRVENLNDFRGVMIPKKVVKGQSFVAEWFLGNFGVRVARVEEVTLAVLDGIEKRREQMIDWGQITFMQQLWREGVNEGGAANEYVALGPLDIKNFKVYLE